MVFRGHWHGLNDTNEIDGVPKVMSPGIKPGQTFTYRIPIRPDPFKYQRDYVVMLSGWTFENTYSVLRKIKMMGSYYDFQKQTVVNFIQSIGKIGTKATFADRMRGGAMRVGPTDIVDVTGSTYRYLMNGMTGGENWAGLLRSGREMPTKPRGKSFKHEPDKHLPGSAMVSMYATDQTRNSGIGLATMASVF